MQIEKCLSLLSQHEKRFHKGLYFVPSENTLSPLARLPFMLDAYSRYFFNNQRVSGHWAFQGGREIGDIERDILIPLLQNLTGAQYIDVRPISGMNGLLIVMGALTQPGDIVLSVPVSMGGHMCTLGIAQRLGLNLHDLPMADPHTIDLNKLESFVKTHQPALIYFDQSTLLFPLDPFPVREIVNRHSPHTLIHFDSSHINGLILGKALLNPLDRGADSFGGSTHKTLPGPHKAFFATNNKDVEKKFDILVDRFISHSHMAEVISLTITLLELQHCDGERYARTVIENAQTFAYALAGYEQNVAGAEKGYTGCHQVWVTPVTEDPWKLSERLYRCGIFANSFDGLPGIDEPSIRLSLSEITKLGMTPEHMGMLASVFHDALSVNIAEQNVIDRLLEIRQQFDHAHYCYSLKNISQDILHPSIKEMWEILERKTK